MFHLRKLRFVINDRYVIIEWRIVEVLDIIYYKYNDVCRYFHYIIPLPQQFELLDYKNDMKVSAVSIELPNTYSHMGRCAYIYMEYKIMF